MNVQYFFPMCVARGCCGSQIKLNIYFKIVEYILRNKVEEWFVLMRSWFFKNPWRNCSSLICVSTINCFKISECEPT